MDKDRNHKSPVPKPNLLARPQNYQQLPSYASSYTDIDTSDSLAPHQTDYLGKPNPKQSLQEKEQSQKMNLAQKYFQKKSLNQVQANDKIQHKNIFMRKSSSGIFRRIPQQQRNKSSQARKKESQSRQNLVQVISQSQMESKKSQNISKISSFSGIFQIRNQQKDDTKSKLIRRQFQKISPTSSLSHSQFDSKSHQKRINIQNKNRREQNIIRKYQQEKKFQNIKDNIIPPLELVRNHKVQAQREVNSIILPKKQVNQLFQNIPVNFKQPICYQCGGPHYYRTCPKIAFLDNLNSRCFNCKKNGHTAKNCKQPRKCSYCNSTQHLAKQCPSYTADKNNKICDNCLQRGHYANQCLEAKKCFICRRPGHPMKDCPQNKNKPHPAPVIKCFNCYKQGHYANQCPEPPRCHRCKKQGHYVKQCPFNKRNHSEEILNQKKLRVQEYQNFQDRAISEAFYDKASQQRIKQSKLKSKKRTMKSQKKTMNENSKAKTQQLRKAIENKKQIGNRKQNNIQFQI